MNPWATFLVVCVVTANGFTFVRLGPRSVAVESRFQGSNENLSETVQPVLGALVASVLLFCDPLDVLAHPYSPSSELACPTIVTAETLKTLDLTLPSYGDLSNAKASVENTKGLALEEIEKPDGGAAKKAPSPQLSALLPSLNKSAARETRSKDTPSKADSKEKKDVKVVTVDMSMPSYGESTTSKGKSMFAIQ